MRLILLLAFIFPLSVQASFLMQYGLNYSSQQDTSDAGEFEESRTFHKAFIAGSINGKKTLFFGWNINSWSSALSQGTASEDTYSMLEMGPRLQWFTSDEYKLFFSVEWNPYARGERDKAGANADISGSSYGVGMGYRFKLSRLLGFGASIHYHSLGISEEKIGSSEQDVTDAVTNLMPMLELTIITR